MEIPHRGQVHCFGLGFPAIPVFGFCLTLFTKYPYLQLFNHLSYGPVNTSHPFLPSPHARDKQWAAVGVVVCPQRLARGGTSTRNSLLLLCSTEQVSCFTFLERSNVPGTGFVMPEVAVKSPKTKPCPNLPLVPALSLKSDCWHLRYI